MSHCRTLGDVVRGRRCFDHLVRINASEPTAYVLMAEIYGDAGMMEECEKMKRGVPIGTIFQVEKIKWSVSYAVKFDDGPHIIRATMN